MEAISGLNAAVVPGYSGGPVPDSNGVPSEALFLSAFTETKKTQAPDNVKIKNPLPSFNYKFLGVQPIGSVLQR